MAETTAGTPAGKREIGRLKRWLLKGQLQEMEGPHEREGQHQQHPWWKVMCLTGVDYFSTLGYQPGIAFLAAGALSPIATLILVLLTLFGALPMYNRVAEASPHGDGSISMLEHLLSRWKGKLFVLVLLGFVATGFIITITLSAADATAHIIENPYVHANAAARSSTPVAITLVLIALLGAVFLKGFKEAIGIAVVLVVVYLLLNLVVIGAGFYQIYLHPEVLGDWTDGALRAPEREGSAADDRRRLAPPLPEAGARALGLRDRRRRHAARQGRARRHAGEPAGTHPQHAQAAAGAAALIMSVMLILSSLVTTLLIPPEEFQPRAPAARSRARPTAARWPTSRTTTSATSSARSTTSARS